MTYFYTNVRVYTYLKFDLKKINKSNNFLKRTLIYYKSNQRFLKKNITNFKTRLNGLINVVRKQ